MLNAIRNIGKEIVKRENLDDEYLVEILVKQINNSKIDRILKINIENGNITLEKELYFKNITKKALYFQAGNGVKGGGIRADYYEEKNREKFENTIKKIAKYCEVTEYLEDIKEVILNEIEESGENFFAVILKNGKYPIEIYKEKFLEDFYNVDFNRLKGKHSCHICQKKEQECFNTTTFKFYTNDKLNYSCINDRNKYGVVICKECLKNIKIGQEFIRKEMKGFWATSSVMFIPHEINEDLIEIYEGTNYEGNLLENIKENESEVFEELGKGRSEIDIIFFEEELGKTLYIYKNIKSVASSRFTELAILLNKYSAKYKLRISSVARDLAISKIGKMGKLDPVQGEICKYLECIFKGKKISRNIFFSRAIKKYKEKYYQNKQGYEIKNIGRNYNFLVECKCLEGGFDCMRDYIGIEELFEANKEYFNTNEKKSWFILGNMYNYINYKIKKKNSGEDGKLQDKTSLDKNFFFARKFDFKDYIFFSNLLSEKMIKHKLEGKYLKENFNNGKELMGKRENKLATDEAKYIFFWGMDSYFKKEEVIIKIDIDKGNRENMESEEN